MILAGQPVAAVTVFGLSSGAVFGLLALGLVLIYRTTGTLNFSHWAIGILAVVAYAILTGSGVNPQIAVLLSIPVSMGAGVLAYRLVFRRIPRSQHIIVVLISVGLAQLFSSIAAFALGFEQFTRIPAWLPATDYHLFGITFKSVDLITMAAALAIAFGFLIWFRRSQAGRALRAVAQNREAAMLAGIDDVRYSSIAWGMGSGLAAVALLLVLPHSAGDRGGLITTFQVTPFGTLLIPAFGAALIGGLVNLPAALIGGFVFGLSHELLVLAPAPWSNLRGAIAAILIVLLLLMRTERFFASRQEIEALEA
ncbi:MAG TPA: branched-chain amino acid ABC transporter permease [Actinomycetota bacterium]|nr:branched-chain amino acid ABC transporter permease [Actinomycetota bacterium]